MVNVVYATVRPRLTEALLALQNSGILTNHEDYSISIVRDDLVDSLAQLQKQQFQCSSNLKTKG